MTAMMVRWDYGMTLMIWSLELFFQVEYSPINGIYGYKVYEMGSRLTY